MPELKKDFLINVGYMVTVGLLIFISFKFLFSVFLPFLIAFIIAYSVQKPSVYISQKIKLKGEICAVILAIFIFILLSLIIIFTVYYFFLKAKDLFLNISGILEDISKILAEVQTKFLGMFENLPFEINISAENLVSNFLENSVEKITSFFSSFAGNIVKGAPTFLFGMIVTLVASCYIAKDYKRLLKFYRNLFGENVYSKTHRIKEIVFNSVIKFIKGYLLLMLFTFFELLVGFYILKVRYAVVLALIVSIVDLLPILGTGTVLVPWGLLEITLSNPRGFGIIILYIFIIFARNFAEPKVIGKQIGINPLFTLTAMFAGLKIMGFAGLIIFPVLLIVIIEYYKNENNLA